MQYYFTLANGVFNSDNAQVVGFPSRKAENHITAEVPEGCTGNLAVAVKVAGSTKFEDITDANINLASPKTLVVRGFVEALELTVSGFSGTGDVVITVTGA